MRVSVAPSPVIFKLKLPMSGSVPLVIVAAPVTVVQSSGTAPVQFSNDPSVMIVPVVSPGLRVVKFWSAPLPCG